MTEKKSSAPKKKAPSKKTAAKKTPPKKTAAAAPPPPPPPEPQSHPELAGAVFAFLAIFTVISYFNTDGAFIAFFSDLLKGLIGWGYWLVAPVFVLCAVILLFHRGRPTGGRLTAALCLPVLFASLANMLNYVRTYTEFDAKAVAGALFEQGQAMESGGAVGGLIAIGLEDALSVYGCAVVLIVAFIFCLLCSTNMTLSKLFSLADKRASRPRAESAPVPQARAEHIEPLDIADELDVPLREEPVRPAPKKKPAVHSFDIPLNEEEELFPVHEQVSPVKAEEAEEKISGGRRVKVRSKKTEPEELTKNVKPLDAAEAAKIAGVSDDTFVRVPMPEKKKSVVASAEIADPPKGKKLSHSDVEAEAQAVANAVAGSGTQTDYEYPPVTLLNCGTGAVGDYRDEVAESRRRLDGALHSFGINAEIVSIIHGPTVTRYDIELEQGVKLSRVTNLAGDIALSLGVVNVRIAPIPDKISTVGIEVPNKLVSTVYLRDVLESSRFTAAKSKLSFALGKDIGGECVVGNISKLPHMLIAGTTGSGKSVCMNSLILSLLYKARPDEVRLIMIDPKMVELGVYNGIPHLYVPVVTDPKKAAGALQWSVVEMLKRYRLFSEAGVRDLESYNKLCQSREEPTMPRVVIVIDELADLMLVASKEVEESICRVAQMGRAAGMHLVIATQRPSADVITGLMKANIPSRIAFAVSSAMESRIILDQGGAEKLVGMGDMLFSPVGCGKPTRIQGAFVSDEERERVIDFIKEGAAAQEQNSEILDFMDKAAEGKNASDKSEAKDSDESDTGDFDEMLPQAVEAVLEAGQCSVSMLQRRVKLGYSRAARIVDQMEELGVVGPYQGSKPRDVVIDRDGWHDIQVQMGFIADDGLSLAREMSEDADE